MKFQWNMLVNHGIRKEIFSWFAQNRLLNPIGLSSILNGLSKMQYEWVSNGNIEKSTCESIGANYHPSKKRDNKYNARGIANIVYYLGELSKNRKNKEEKHIVDKDVFDSIWNGIITCSKNFNAQEIGNIIYG
jgi:hypothetical protein